MKAIIFDFGGVFTRTHPRLRVLRHCERDLGLPSGELTTLLFASSHWRDVSAGRVSPDLYWHRVKEELGANVPPQLQPFKHNPFAYELLNKRMVGLGRRLHRHYATALLSNATLHLDSLLAEQDLTSLFDFVINSARVRLRKPDPRIYHLTLDRLRLSPAECLFVDDKVRNTMAAQALGIPTIVFHSAAQLTRKLRDLGILPS